MTNNRLRESIRRNLITEIQNACDGQGLSSSQYQDCLTNCCDAGDSDCCDDLGTDEMTVGGNDNELENIGIKGVRRNDKDMAKRRPYSAKARDMRGSVKEGVRRRLSEAAMCWTDNDCQAGEICNKNGADLSSDGKTGRCRKGGGMSIQDRGGRGVPDYDYIDHEDRDEYDGRKSRVVGVDSNIKKQRRLNEAPYCPGGCPDGCSCVHHGLYGRCDCGLENMPMLGSSGKEDVMRKKKRMRSAANAIGDLKEYTRNRTNIERFLNEKEDKEMGTPDPKKVLAIAKKVLTGGNPPSTGMNNWWCCLLACPDPGCKGDRWEVVMHPWG